MQKRIAIVVNNIVDNVVIWDDDNGPFPAQEGILAIENGWASPGDWWEAAEQRFYRAIPNNDDFENVAEDQSV